MPSASAVPRPSSRPPLHALGAPIVLLALLLSGCAAEADAPDGGRLVIERTTENGVTTVRNVSGSTWQGPAHLAEELSIGVLEGDEEYMFGRIGGLWVTDEAVYVVDAQAPAIRVFDHDGTYVRSIGGAGQGPGEYDRPGQIVVFDDGSLVVEDNGNRRLVFFHADGQAARTWRPDEGYVFGLDLGRDSSLLVQLGLPPENQDPANPVFDLRGAVATVGADGQLGRMRFVPEFEGDPGPLVVREGGGVMVASGNFLFRPAVSWATRPDGAIVAGLSDRYRFEIHAPDGTRTVVEKAWEPVPVSPEEAAYAVAELEGRFRRMSPEWSYAGPPVADHKPAFLSLTADRDGRVWALHRLASARARDCVEDPREDPDGAGERPCWDAAEVLDVFAADGSYLGEVRRPEGLRFGAVFIRGHTYWAAVEDDDGLLTVRRFRIAAPDAA